VNGHPLEQYCQSRADRLVKLPNDLPSQVQAIRADELDILLISTIVNDITADSTLLALHRLGRIQATYFVNPATTGMRNIDYYISGNLMEPVQKAQEHYREKLITLDGTGFCFSFGIEPDIATVKPERRSIGVTDESVVFVSGASPVKIIPELRETWAKILVAVPNSVLVLYPSHSDQYLHRNMSAVFAKYGIEKNRLIILKIKGRSNVKECLKLCDVYLHSYPYTGAASIVEALEIGLPTVVREGDALRNKIGAAFMRELQLPDLIANSEESYVQLAIALGTNPELREEKRNQIKQKMQSNPRFMDSCAYSAQMGSLFQELFKQHLNS
jgi:predicted O-linked N-acetylglucosamine transferase (SPINDLY family)